jgi:hypothetical protein
MRNFNRYVLRKANVNNLLSKKVQGDVEKWKILSNQKGAIPLYEALLLFKKHFEYFPSVTIPDATQGMSVFRTRVIAKDSTEDITDPKTFSYAPVARTLCYQRANTPGHPVFYAAIDGKTALKELRINGNEPVKRGDQIYLSEWRAKQGEKFELNCLTIPDLIGEEYFVGPIAQQLNFAIPIILSKLPPQLKEVQIYLMAELASIFLKGSYFQSGVIAHHLIYELCENRADYAEGIVYPSCANNFESLNFALHPTFVDKSMELINVRKISFDEFTNDGFQSKSSYFANIIDGRIQWSKYVSNMRMDFQVNLKLSESWTSERTNLATFYEGEKEWIFDLFCDYLIDNVDFSQQSINPESEKAYIEGTGVIFDLTFEFDDGQCTFKDANGYAYLTGLWLRIPVDTCIQNVSTEEVIKN